MSSTLRILFVAYCFPPSADVGRIRVVRFCDHLPGYDIEPVILTVQSQFYTVFDHNWVAPSGLRVVRSNQWKTPLDWYSSWKSAQSAVAVPQMDASKPENSTSNTGAGKRFRDNLVSAFSVPDFLWGWYFPATRTGRRLLKNEHFDAIVSTAPPFTAHLIAKNLQKKFRIPWIADFRDPWVTDRTLRSSQWNWRQKLDKRMEGDCVRSAALVVCNTDWQQRVMSQRYPDIPEDRFITLTNGFDDDAASPELTRVKGKPILCLHLGNVYGGRRIDIFCAALSLMVQERKVSADETKIVFVGDIEDSQLAACRRVAGDLIDSGMIEFRRRVDSQEAKKILSEADLLLLFQGEFRAQIPLKFYEYLSTGKPMFAVCQPGALSDVIMQTDAGISVGDQDPREIGEQFLSALQLQSQPPEVVQQRWTEQFHFRSLTRRLAERIRCLVRRNA
jgi:Glycosyltransferase Family 4